MEEVDVFLRIVLPFWAVNMRLVRHPVELHHALCCLRPISSVDARGSGSVDMATTDPGGLLDKDSRREERTRASLNHVATGAQE